MPRPQINPEVLKKGNNGQTSTYTKRPYYGGGMPRKPRYVPSEQDLEYVRGMGAMGYPEHMIARQLKIAPTDEGLRTWLKEEILKGKEEANEKVANVLFRMATSGVMPTATFFWLKTQARWRETDRPNEEKLPTINIIVKGGIDGVEVQEDTTPQYTNGKYKGNGLAHE